MRTITQFKKKNKKNNNFQSLLDLSHGKNSFLISELVTLHDLPHPRKALQTGSSCNRNGVCPSFHQCLCEGLGCEGNLSLNSLTFSSNREVTLLPFLPLLCAGGKGPEEARSPISVLPLPGLETHSFLQLHGASEGQHPSSVLIPASSLSQRLEWQGDIFYVTRR